MVEGGVASYTITGLENGVATGVTVESTHGAGTLYSSVFRVEWLGRALPIGYAK